MGCRFVPLAMDNKGTSVRRDLDLIRRYVALMRSVSPDVYLGYTIKPNVYGSLAAHYIGGSGDQQRLRPRYRLHPQWLADAGCQAALPRCVFAIPHGVFPER